MESFGSLLGSFCWTRDDTIRFDSDKPEVLGDDREGLFTLFGKWSIEIHTIEVIEFYSLRMTHEDDLFFLRIVEHGCIIYKNTPIQVGVFFSAYIYNLSFIIHDFYASFILSTPETISETSFVMAAWRVLL